MAVSPSRPWHSLTIIFVSILSRFIPPGRQNCHHHLESTPIQNPKLVLEQTKGYHWWQIPAIDLIQFGFKIAWRFGTFEENPCPSWYASLLGSSCTWSTHKNNRPPWTYRWCIEKEVNLNVKQQQQQTIMCWIHSCYTATESFSCVSTSNTAKYANFVLYAFLLRYIQTIKHANTINNNTNTRWITWSLIKIPLKFVLRFISCALFSPFVCLFNLV